MPELYILIKRHINIQFQPLMQNYMESGMKKSIIVILFFALTNLSCGLIGWSTLKINNDSSREVHITCSYSWDSTEDGYTETNPEYWTMDLKAGESGEETIYGDTGTHIGLTANNGLASADISYTVSVDGDKTITITDLDFD